MDKRRGYWPFDAKKPRDGKGSRQTGQESNFIGERAQAWFVLAAVAAMAVAIVFYLFFVVYRVLHYGQLSEHLFDDAFFFVRYAGNFLDTGKFEWNQGEGPVYGNTSQFYQLLIALLLWLLDRDIVLTVFVGSSLGALAYLFILPLAYAAARPRIDPTLRFLVLALVVVFIGFNGQIFLLIGNGMETTWAMAMVALSLLAAFRVENAENRGGAAAVSAVAIALVFSTRPDAALLAFAGPAGLVIFSQDRGLRMAGLAACLGGGVLVAAFIALCWLYYGDPLPLASVTKSSLVSMLPAHQRLEGLGDPARFLQDALALNKVETLLALVALTMFFRLSPVLRGAALGMAFFAVYHLFFVIPIMGHNGRFFAPMIPILTLLAACAAEAIIDRIRLRRWAAWASTAAAAGVGLLLLHRAVLLSLAVSGEYSPTLTMDSSINTKEGALVAGAERFKYYDDKLDDLAASLGDDCSAASTENGFLSALARRAPMIDISGLHDRRMVREGFSVARLLEEQRPDVLVRPPPWYVEWIAALENHPALERDYMREGLSTQGEIWIAFRRDSACAARVRKAVFGK